MPKCRICHQPIDKNNNDWCMPSQNFYYHTKCYTDWRASQPMEDNEWIPMIYDFLARDLKVSYNWWLCDSQRKKFIKENKCTNKGIYFTLKYFYEVKKNAWDKGHGGIGIVPYTYKEATEYWTEQERKRRGFIQGIEKQLQERAARDVVKVKRTETKKKKQKYSLDDIGGAEDG